VIRAAVVTALLATAALAAAPAASAEVVWLCEPGMADNPCEIAQDTTVREHGKPDRVETPVTGPRGVDCFYVYPTVSNQPTPNASKSRDPELESIAKYQAARFSTQCRVFAPIYRQTTLASIAAGMTGGSTGADRELAFSDVLEAWREYLAEENGGRGVVLVGHSQGTFMLRELVKREIEQHKEQRRLIVSGLLLGGDVEVAKGRLVGGDFARTVLCTEPAQVGCIVAFSTFAEDPPEDARFGTTANEGMEVACTDPRLLAGWTDPLRVLTPSEPFAPGLIQAGIVITSGGVPPTAPTTWVVAPDRYEGTCDVINGAHVLRYHPLGESRAPNYYPQETWGTHLIDVNLALDPLVSLVAQQAERWTDPRIRLARRCSFDDARVRLSLRGRDSEFVRRVAFKAGRRTLARDARAPFTRTVDPTGGKLRAVASLKYGEPERLVLKRGPARCG